jgi:hypothetical protein
MPESQPFTQAETLTIANVAGAILSGIVADKGIATAEDQVLQAVTLAVKVLLHARRLGKPAA